MFCPNRRPPLQTARLVTPFPLMTLDHFPPFRDICLLLCRRTENQCLSLECRVVLPRVAKYNNLRQLLLVARSSLVEGIPARFLVHGLQSDIGNFRAWLLKFIESTGSRWIL